MQKQYKKFGQKLWKFGEGHISTAAYSTDILHLLLYTL